MNKNKFEKKILHLIILVTIFLFTQCSSTQQYNSNSGYQSDMDRISSDLRRKQDSEIIKFDYTHKYRPSNNKP